ALHLLLNFPLSTSPIPPLCFTFNIIYNDESLEKKNCYRLVLQWDWDIVLPIITHLLNEGFSYLGIDRPDKLREHKSKVLRRVLTNIWKDGYRRYDV
ncbi:hypothetical protein, partial [Salmonella sp. s58313]|uniref:hypothetical protein n=1 Tax=Salmonella sp. s58313 TaxID=3160131 RepID=UPI0037545350